MFRLEKECEHEWEYKAYRQGGLFTEPVFPAVYQCRKCLKVEHREA